MKGSKRRIVATILVALILLLIPSVALTQVNNRSKSTTSTFKFNIGDTVYLYLGEQDDVVVAVTYEDLVTLLKYIEADNLKEVTKFILSDKAFMVDKGTPAQIIGRNSYYSQKRGISAPVYGVKILSGDYKDSVGWIPGFECKSERSRSDLGLEESSRPNFEFVESTHYVDGGYGFGYIVGTIRNNTSRKYRYVQISFSLYDKSGNKIGTTFDVIDELGPGETWRFKAPVINGDELYDYKLDEITAW
jgi:hypothetical protein